VGPASALSCTRDHAEYQRTVDILLFRVEALHFSPVVTQAPPSQALGVFASVVVIVSLGSLVVTVQAKVRRS
jgi:hypothetical protein